MIAQIAYVPDLPQPVVLFLRELQAAGFEGDIDSSDAMRSVMSTDNSIYQQRPQALLFPKHEDDVQRIARLAGQPMHRKVTLTPRGGGTGTNGQSLTTGIVVDLSKYLNKIVDIDVVNRRVHVQAGVVKDQLNAALKPHGLFFAPELSTSNRATIGGMIATDASGQGSCTYGKMRHHVIALDSVFIGGGRHTSRSIDAQELERLSSRDDAVGTAYRTAAAIAVDNKDEIARTFPRLNRSMTGYDLAHLQEAPGVFNLNSVICGAEGTLAIVVGATLNVLPIPRHTALVNICYSSFMDALRDAQALMQQKPLSIETVDSKVLSLAMKDPVWLDIARYFPDHPRGATLGINLVEFVAEDLESLNALLTAFTEGLTSTDTSARLGYTIAEGHAAVDRVYAMRKRAVGLLGNTTGEARPQPFVEDTAVPPQHLADYIEEFRALLDRYELTYGMFGHVDAGVLHVRPALDLKNPDHAALVRPISDAVVALTQKYGGVLWGEHGKGVRSEYVPAFFGNLYPALRRLKGAFDPNNQLNPGKIASAGPAVIPLLKIDQVPLRGEHDRQIDERVWTSYGNAMHCNGNGACYNFDPDDAMCPSWKGTRDRIHSPKGRASLIREWLRLQQRADVDVLAVVANPPSLLGGALGRWRTELGPTQRARRLLASGLRRHVWLSGV